MKATILALMMLLANAGAFAQNSTATNAGKLTVYYAKANMKRPYRESYFRGQYYEFKKDQYISDSQANFYTLKSKDKTYYLYGGEYDSDYSSCLIPKTNVTTKTYDIGEMPLSVIGEGIQLAFNDGTVCKMFVANSNGHKFHKYDSDNNNYQYDAQTTRQMQRFCVLQYSTEWGLQEYFIPIEGDHVKLYEKGKCILHSTDWVNYRDYNEAEEATSSFDSNGNLIKDLYSFDGKPEVWEGLCYIPSLNKMYLGNGTLSDIIAIKK